MIMACTCSQAAMVQTDTLLAWAGRALLQAAGAAPDTVAAECAAPTDDQVSN